MHRTPWEAGIRDLEAASRLLDVTSRDGLAEFVSELVTGASGGRLSRDAARALTGVLTTTALRTVPTLSALVGARRAVAPHVYGLALEGMSAEDRDHELAHRFVRFAEAAAGRAARTPDGVAAAVEAAAREFVPGLAPRPGKESRMFETESPTAEYGEAEYGRRGRRGRWADDDEYGGQGEAPYEAEHGYGEYEQAGQGEYGQGQYGHGEYGGHQESEEAEEERFLPLIPLAGKVLGGLLGGLMKEGEAEGQYESGYGEAEAEAEGEGEGEAEDEFLGKILKRVLGQEAEHDELALSPAQEAEFAGHLMEVSNEQELDHFLGGLVNTVGKVVQGVRGAANSPQGRALIAAVKPLAKSALPALGGAIGTAIAPGIGTQVGSALGTAAGSLFEGEASLTQEQEEFETARRIVRLASAAAQDVASAPSGGSPRLVGELSLFRASRRFAPSLYRRGLRRLSPMARRFYGRRYRSFRRRYGSSSYRRHYGYHGFGYRPHYGHYGYGYPYQTGPEPEPAPSQPPGPPQPGFKWVAVPVDAPEPAAEPAPPAGDAAPASGEYAYSANGRGRSRDGGL
ncbi:hypothetical protein [Amycolatopsis solani]|uniref:hypothetical protein n=1 Tax=Amycolatopsis solani TaxID=3028615 RepID=UPI0025B0BC94|nr:hypothetical protein [Amycolatopsis sp. MEP2-6]